MRGKQGQRRTIAPDLKFQSLTIAKFINHVMQSGKKQTAQKIVYRCFDIIREETGEDPLGLFNKALKNLTPDVEVRSKRVGGATYQVPYQVKGQRRMSLAFRWLIKASKERRGKNMSYKLKDELIAAQNKEGGAVKIKENIERMADANRAFAHFAR